MLAVLFVFPICSLASALFSARSIPHVLLISFAAPLLAAGLIDVNWPRSVATGPISAAGLHALAFWIWHVPALYAAALGHVAVYWAMQLTLLISAVLVWRAVLDPRTEVPTALLALLVLVLQMGFLGAVLTFAREPLYAPHLLTTATWGLSPFEDQQIAGLLMWAPGMLPYVYVTLRVMVRSLVEHGAWRDMAWSRS